MTTQVANARGHHHLDHVSAHQQEQSRMSGSQMIGTFTECVTQLRELQSVQPPLNSRDAHRLADLNAKSQLLEGHFNHALREGNGTLPGMTPGETKNIYDNSQQFKAALDTLNKANESATQQQLSSQRQNSGRGNFTQKISNSSQPVMANRASPQFASQMQAEANHFSKIAQGMSTGHLHLSPQEKLKTAEHFERFESYTQRNNVQLDPHQHQQMQYIFGTAKQHAKQEIEQQRQQKFSETAKGLRFNSSCTPGGSVEGTDGRTSGTISFNLQHDDMRAYLAKYPDSTDPQHFMSYLAGEGKTAGTHVSAGFNDSGKSELPSTYAPDLSRMPGAGAGIAAQLKSVKDAINQNVKSDISTPANSGNTQRPNSPAYKNASPYQTSAPPQQFNNAGRNQYTSSATSTPYPSNHGQWNVAQHHPHSHHRYAQPQQHSQSAQNFHVPQNTYNSRPTGGFIAAPAQNQYGQYGMQNAAPRRTSSAPPLAPKKTVNQIFSETASKLSFNSSCNPQGSVEDEYGNTSGHISFNLQHDDMRAFQALHPNSTDAQDFMTYLAGQGKTAGTHTTAGFNESGKTALPSGYAPDLSRMPAARDNISAQLKSVKDAINQKIESEVRTPANSSNAQRPNTGSHRNSTQSRIQHMQNRNSSYDMRTSSFADKASRIAVGGEATTSGFVEYSDGSTKGTMTLQLDYKQIGKYFAAGGTVNAQALVNYLESGGNLNGSYRGSHNAEGDDVSSMQGQLSNQLRDRIEVHMNHVKQAIEKA